MTCTECQGVLPVQLGSGTIPHVARATIVSGGLWRMAAARARMELVEVS